MYRIQVDSSWRKITDEFKQLSDKKQWELLMKDAAHQMKREAKNLCPVDTGMLRDSIYIRKMGSLQYEMGFTVHYGVWNEYGWYAIAEYVGDGDQNPIHYKGGYRPFMRPAVWKVINEMPMFLEQYFTILK